MIPNSFFHSVKWFHLYLIQIPSSFSIIINEDHLINLMIEEGILECADGK